MPFRHQPEWQQENSTVLISPTLPHSCRSLLQRCLDYALMPPVLWLVFATGLSVYSMLYTHDEFLNIGPFLFRTK